MRLNQNRIVKPSLFMLPAAVLSLVVMLSVAVFAYAGHKVTVNIPFDFMIGNQQLPAGRYIIQRVTDQGTLIIRNTETQTSLSLIAHDVYRNREDKAGLEFHRYSSQNFLAQVHEGEGLGVEFPKSKAERNAATDHFAQRASKPETIIVPAQIEQ